MSTLKLSNLQIGRSNDVQNNFTLSSSVTNDGTMKLSRGNPDATVSDIFSVDASGNLSFNNRIASVGGLPSYECRAWVNFQGTGTVTIRGSGNVASVVDIGTGFYDVVFLQPMPDENYATILGSGNNATGIHGSQQAVYHRAPTTTFVSILAADDTGQSGAEDAPWVDVAIFR